MDKDEGSPLARSEDKYRRVCAGSLFITMHIGLDRILTRSGRPFPFPGLDLLEVLKIFTGKKLEMQTAMTKCASSCSPLIQSLEF
jgi:hypothetical protein